jgi:hypothetical protein
MVSYTDTQKIIHMRFVSDYKNTYPPTRVYLDTCIHKHKRTYTRRSWIPELGDIDPPNLFAPWLQDSVKESGARQASAETAYPAPCVPVAEVSDSNSSSVGGCGASGGLFHGHAADRVRVTNDGGDLRFLDFDQVGWYGGMDPLPCTLVSFVNAVHTADKCGYRSYRSYIHTYIHTYMHTFIYIYIYILDSSARAHPQETEQKYLTSNFHVQNVYAYIKNYYTQKILIQATRANQSSHAHTHARTYVPTHARTHAHAVKDRRSHRGYRR